MNGLARAASVLALTLGFCSPAAGDAAPQRIAFGSCLYQALPHPILFRIAASRPDLFIFMGDNIYADTRSAEVMRRKYEELRASPSFRRLLSSCPTVATWDDHDYGANDAGEDFPAKEQSRRLFLDFWGEPPDSPRRRHPGVYTSYEMGPPERRVQVLLLDTRWFRSPLLRANRRASNSKGPYVPNPDPQATLLGREQWRWLEGQLRRPAALRLLVSSIQVIPDTSGWEAWANFPRERSRLLALLDRLRANGVILLSGDRHFAEISRLARRGAYPLYEVTSSALNFGFPADAPNPNPYRVDGYTLHPNYGTVEIDWQQGRIVLAVHDAAGQTVLRQELALGELSYPRRQVQSRQVPRR